MKIEEKTALLKVIQGLRFRLETSLSFGWQVPVRVPRQGPRTAVREARATEGSELASERHRRQSLLSELQDRVRSCKKCVLHQKRTQTVFGVGDPCARLMLVGEGPGYDEDRLGEPFVGKAGQLLDRMLAAMGLRRSQVYIANVVKCRPPANRTPEPSERMACFSFLRQQIQIVRPKVICAMGNTPTRTLLNTDLPISRMRGQFYEFQGAPVMPTFHPAYLLRHPRDKRLAWEDLQKIIALLGLQPASPAAAVTSITPKIKST